MITPQCSHFGVCGGCAHQDHSYEEQLELKQAQVTEALSPFGPNEFLPTVPSPKSYHYRHMISPSVKKRHGELRIGFMGKNRRDFVPVESCAIADERLNDYLPEALRRLSALPEKKRFRTSQIVLRVGSGGEVVTSLREDRKKIIEAAINGKHFSYAVSSFFQHNFSILNSLVHAVRAFLAPDRRKLLLDLYCGVGVFAISLAEEYAQAIGIEEGYEAIEQALRNAQRNAVSNASFHEGKVERLLPEILGGEKIEGQMIQAVIDPPRAGLKPEVVKVFCDHSERIERLVYVSCELSALRRDLELLTERFTIERVQPIDLFPQTPHIETVVLLQSKGISGRKT